MHPPLIMLMRRVLRDLLVGDHVVRPGGIALVSPAAAHRIPRSSRTPTATIPIGSPRAPGGPEAPARPDRIRRRPPPVHRLDLRLPAGQGDLVRAPPALRALARAPRPRCRTTRRSSPGPAQAMSGAVPAAARGEPARLRARGGRPGSAAVDDRRLPRSRTRATSGRRRGRRARPRPLVRRGVRRSDPAGAGRSRPVLAPIHRGLSRHRRQAPRAREPLRPPPAQAVLGEVTGCTLTCAYHGWCYDEDGAVVASPTTAAVALCRRSTSAPIRCSSATA